LYYVSNEGRMMAVPIGTGTKFRAGAPAALFETRLSPVLFYNWAYDVSRDGRFLMIEPAENATPPPMTLIVNWQAGLKR